MDACLSWARALVYTILEKEQTVNEGSVVVKRSVQFIIDTHCVTRKLIINANRLSELSLNYLTIYILVCLAPLCL
jgi:hypothetical protein